jgi:hypothetical protein
MGVVHARARVHRMRIGVADQLKILGTRGRGHQPPTVCEPAQLGAVVASFPARNPLMSTFELVVVQRFAVAASHDQHSGGVLIEKTTRQPLTTEKR